MSRIPKPGAKRDTSAPSRPQSAVGSRPQSSMAKPRVTSAKGDTKETKGATKKEKKPLYPALSVPFKELPPDPMIERLKRKTIRRNAPPGEDLKKIKAVIKQMQGEVITVQEFVGLISPYTGDNGEALRKIMSDDLSSFRRMAKRVYDTMTQDVSDVLANEQIHITEYYNERYTLYMEKMMRSIDEIYRYVPHFDFEKYYKESEEYLLELFPLRQVAPVMDAEEEEMHRRQEAFHRLEWLRSEGVRLAEENAQLQQRLRELKKMQQDEMVSSRQQEEMAEIRKSHLEATQAELQNHLQELNDSVEKSFVEQEQSLRMEQDANLEGRYLERKEEKRKEKTATLVARARSRTKPWNVKAAKEVEEKALEVSATSAASSVSVASIASKSTLERKKKAKKPSRPPFHFSPIKTPPPDVRPPKEASPFHYSPPRSPLAMEPEPAAASPPPMRRLRVEAASAAVQQEPQRYIPTLRRSVAPRDTWGGFL